MITRRIFLEKNTETRTKGECFRSSFLVPQNFHERSEDNGISVAITVFLLEDKMDFEHDRTFHYVCTSTCLFELNPLEQVAEIH